MTVSAPGSNAHLRNRDEKALKRLEKLTEQYVADGMPEKKARQRAQVEMRDNSRKDWRGG